MPPHYEPVIGRTAARQQVEMWWTREYLAPAVDAGALVVAEADGEVIGVAQRGEWDGDPVVWKLYVHPERRGQGVGRDLLRAVTAELPRGTSRVLVDRDAARSQGGCGGARTGRRSAASASLPVRAMPAAEGTRP